MAYYAGKNSSVTISASARPMDTWSLDLKCDPVDVTNFTSSGYQENVAGVFSADVSFGGPFDGTEGISQGDSVAVTLGVHASLSYAVTVRLSSVKISTDVKGVARIDATGTSNGSFSITP